MTNVDLIRVNHLRVDDWNRWKAFQNSNPKLSNPYFSHEFTQAVDAVRDDVLVARIRNGDDIIAYFPFQRTSSGHAVPVGGRMSDFHGVIGQRDAPIDGRWLAKQCDFTDFTFDNLPVWQTGFSSGFDRTDQTAHVDVSHGWESYARVKTDEGSNLIMQTQRKRRKLHRDHGEVRFEFHTTNEMCLSQLVAWKSEQYRDTHVTDVFSFGLTVDLVRHIFRQPTENFGAVLSVLRVGDRIAAMHFALRTRTVLHCWFPVYDQGLSGYSPGAILFLELCRELPQRGFERIDLGRLAPWKSRFMTSTSLVAEGVLDLSPWRQSARRTWQNVKAKIKQSPLRSVARLPARIVYAWREQRSFQ